MKSIYIHIPFCLKKCNYCDFFSIRFNKNIEKDYIKSLCNSIKEKAHNLKDEIETIYIGGGTPSLLSNESIDIIFNALSNYNISKNAEITIEVNPATCNGQKLKFLNRYFNRISIGVQSFNDNELKFLGRLHNSKEAENTINDAYNSGFENISLDLMYSIPFQTEKSFKYSINKALSLPITHLSAYELSIEENTPFYRDNVLKYINEDIDFDNILNDNLKNNCFYKYEVSNYSKIGYESKHNINYWNNNEYLGFGAGAVGYINNVRYKYVSNVKNYIENYDIEYSEILNNKDKAFENLMLGLRMVKGFNINRVIDFLTNDEKKAFLNKIHSLTDYLVLENNYLRTTPKGMNFLNNVILELDTFRN